MTPTRRHTDFKLRKDRALLPDLFSMYRYTLLRDLEEKKSDWWILESLNAALDRSYSASLNLLNISSLVELMISRSVARSSATSSTSQDIPETFGIYSSSSAFWLEMCRKHLHQGTPRRTRPTQMLNRPHHLETVSYHDWRGTSPVSRIKCWQLAFLPTTHVMHDICSKCSASRSHMLISWFWRGGWWYYHPSLEEICRHFHF